MSKPRYDLQRAASPTSEAEEIVAEERAAAPEDGIGLCLSGGGYRAVLFHAGAILRLNEASLLLRLRRISSVSGGSITAGVLGMNWSSLASSGGVVSNLEEQLVDPIRKIASQTIDRGAVVGGVLLPGTVAERIVDSYDSILFGGRTLQDLPADGDGPRFVINATSVQTGALVRFSRPYLADHEVGLIREPRFRLAEAVAASSAFPPVLSPLTLDVEPSDFDPQTRGPLHHEPFTEEMVLTDGGVYDNLGLETVWKRYQSVLVSDGGGQLAPEKDPASDWVQHAIRVGNVIDNQVRSLRKRQVIGGFVSGDDPHDGTYWGIRTDIANYGLDQTLPCPHSQTLALAALPTRLKRLPRATQNQVMNWGYAVCDAALRRHFSHELPDGFDKPVQFPFEGGIG